MRKFILLTILLIAPSTYAQYPLNYELLCPPGAQPESGPSGSSLNPSTGKLRANICIDGNGNTIYQGQGVLPPQPNSGLVGFYQTAFVDQPSGNLTSYAITLPNKTVIGDLIFVVSRNANTLVPIDTQGNTYTSIGTNTGFYAFAQSTSTNVVTWRCSVVCAAQVTVAEYSGVLSFDTAPAITSPSGNSWTSNNITPTANGDLLLGYGSNSTTNGPTYTPGAGYTLRGTGQNAFIEDSFQATAALTTATLTTVNYSGTFGVVAFKTNVSVNNTAIIQNISSSGSLTIVSPGNITTAQTVNAISEGCPVPTNTVWNIMLNLNQCDAGGASIPSVTLYVQANPSGNQAGNTIPGNITVFEQMKCQSFVSNPAFENCQGNESEAFYQGTLAVTNNLQLKGLGGQVWIDNSTTTTTAAVPFGISVWGGAPFYNYAACGGSCGTGSFVYAVSVRAEQPTASDSKGNAVGSGNRAALQITSDFTNDPAVVNWDKTGTTQWQLLATANPSSQQFDFALQNTNVGNGGFRFSNSNPGIAYIRSIGTGGVVINGNPTFAGEGVTTNGTGGLVACGGGSSASVICGLGILNSGILCTMAAGTTCTATVPTGSVHCNSTVQGATAIAAACSISGTTLTVTAGAANSATWLSMVTL